MKKQAWVLILLALASASAMAADAAKTVPVQNVNAKPVAAASAPAKAVDPFAKAEIERAISELPPSTKLVPRPDYRARLGEVAERYPEWRPLVQAWPTLSQLHQKGNQGLQEAMVALQKEVNRIHLENA